MKDRITFYLLTSLALSGVFTLAAYRGAKARVSTNQAQSLRFDDKAGRNIEIGMYGNVLRLPGVRPIREGYAFAYLDPQSPEKVKVVYYADKQLSFGLKPVSLTSNVPAGTVALGQEVIITAVVATDDGLFQSTHEFRWTAGNNDLEVTRSIKKMGSDAFQLRWFNGALTLNVKEFSGDGDVVSFSSPESCPPPPPPDDRCPQKVTLKVSRHVAWAVDESSGSAKSLLGELSHDHFPPPKQGGKYDVVFGLRSDSPMSKDQSLTLNYVYHMEPKVNK